MKKKHISVFLKCLVVLLITAFLKIILIKTTSIFNTEYNIESKYAIKYEEVEMSQGQESFVKPVFNIPVLDKKIDEYISTNSCEYLNYNVKDLGNNRVSVFLDCGFPSSTIYDMTNKKDLKFLDLVKNYDSFKSNVNRLLRLKYPGFVADDVDYDSSIFDIKENEIIGYFKTHEYGDLLYHINNNEIKDLMDYPMSYEDAYENEVFSLDSNKKTVSFSFDDGPSEYDIEILKLLEDAHATATFFYVGNRLESYPSVVERLATSNMEIGNHTFSHKVLTKLDDEKIKNEITTTNDVFKSMTGKEMNLLRPSYGAINKRVLLQVEMPITLWSIDTEDWKVRNSDKIYEVIMNNATDGDIVLMHSLYKTTVEAVDKTLKGLYKEGYQVVSISELAKLRNVQLLAGHSYLSIK